MKIEQKLGNVLATMTPSVFASLPPIHADDAMSRRILARVDPVCNRQFDDHPETIEVVTRVLVYLPDDDFEQPWGLTGLRRLTIRESNLDFDSQNLADYLSGQADSHMLDRWRMTKDAYWICMGKALDVPTIDLSDPLRSGGVLR